MFRHWMRHTAMVPKGFLRFYVLKLLSEKPMSGSEVMQEIENMSRGNWKPSPGSIYRLMAWLQERGYVEETPTAEKGIKRYALTEHGKKFLEESAQGKEEIQRRFRFIGPPFFPGAPRWESNPLLPAGRRLCQPLHLRRSWVLTSEHNLQIDNLSL